MQDLEQHINVLKKHGYDQDEALIILWRLQLIKVINAEINRRQWTQRKAAALLKVPQPRIAEIAVLASEKFSVEFLLKLIQRLGLKASLIVKPGKNYVRPERIKPTMKHTKRLQGKTKASGFAIPKSVQRRITNTKKALID